MLAGAPVFHRSDYTFLATRKQFERWREAANEKPKGKSKPPELPFGREVQIPKEGEDSEGIALHGRAQFASCFAGRMVSVTVRVSSNMSVEAKEYEPPAGKGGQPTWSPEKDHEHGLLSIAEVVTALSELILPDHPTGLIVISGSTNSAKSLVARGLIHQHLRQQAARNGRKRHPHLVTFEDPIEQYFYAVTASRPDEIRKASQGWLIDYTPQDRDQDRVGLDQVLLAAKRQTPSVLFVGETREREDWERLIEFAGSGHLIVTTSHASNLSETMERILESCDAKSPMQWGSIAQRILAVVHQRTVTTEGLPPVLLPSVWRRNDNGISEMIANGLSSIIPYNPPSRRGGRRASLGRSWFLNRVLREDPHPDVADLIRDDQGRDTEAFRRLAHEVYKLDLRGE